MSAPRILMTIVIASVVTNTIGATANKATVMNTTASQEENSTLNWFQAINLTALQGICSEQLTEFRQNVGYFNDLKAQSDQRNLSLYVACSFVELYTTTDLNNVKLKMSSGNISAEVIKVQPSALFHNINSSSVAEHRCNIAVAAAILRQEITDDANENEAYATCDDIKKNLTDDDIKTINFSGTTSYDGFSAKIKENKDDRSAGSTPGDSSTKNKEKEEDRSAGSKPGHSSGTVFMLPAYVQWLSCMAALNSGY